MPDDLDVQILTDRVRAHLAVPLTEKRMFGGLTFMLNGNMLCMVSRRGLMVRVGAAAEADALTNPHASRCCGSASAMTGFLSIAPEGLATDNELRHWLDLASAYVGGLPAKEPKPRKAKPPAARSRKRA